MIRRFYGVEQVRQISRQDKRSGEPARDAQQRQPQPALDDKTHHIALLRAQRHPHADLAPALRHRIRHHPVDAYHGEQQRHSRKAAQQGRVHSPRGRGVREPLFHRHQAVKRLVRI